MTILYFIISLGILVLVHELGHFIFARMNGVRVEKFSIGFGPKILGFKRGETEYKIAPIPLGGYIKMTGEDEETTGTTDERSFANKSAWQKIKVVAAGPLMNLVLAAIVMPIVFMVGRMEPAFLGQSPILMGIAQDSPAEKAGLKKDDKILEIAGSKVDNWQDVLNKVVLAAGTTLDSKIERDGQVVDKKLNIISIPELKGGYAGFEPILFLGNEALIDHVVSKGPAEQAGIKPKDKVISFDGKPVDGWIEMASLVNEVKGKTVDIVVERENQKIPLKITPEYSKDYEKWVLGVWRDRKSADIPMVKVRYGFIDSIKHGLSEFASLTGLTLQVMKKLFSFQLSIKALGGPIQIAQASAVAASYGVSEFLYFMAFLSLQLGLLNLLPIPVLDGGQILFCIIEAIIRRPIPVKVRSVAQYAGLALILSVMLLVTVNDVDNVWGIKKIISKWFVK